MGSPRTQCPISLADAVEVIGGIWVKLVEFRGPGERRSRAVGEHGQMYIRAHRSLSNSLILHLASRKDVGASGTRRFLLDQCIHVSDAVFQFGMVVVVQLGDLALILFLQQPKNTWHLSRFVIAF